MASFAAVWLLGLLTPVPRSCSLDQVWGGARGGSAATQRHVSRRPGAVEPCGLIVPRPLPPGAVALCSRTSLVRGRSRCLSISAPWRIYPKSESGFMSFVSGASNVPVVPRVLDVFADERLGAVRVVGQQSVQDLLMLFS